MRISSAPPSFGDPHILRNMIIPIISWNVNEEENQMLEAFLALATETLKLISKMIDTQPPEVQKQLWEWYVEDMRRWRKLLHIDDEIRITAGIKDIIK